MKTPEFAPYQPHEALVSAARARPQLWRLLVGLSIVVCVFITLNTLLYGTFQIEVGTGATPISMLFIMGGFGIVTLGVMVAARVIQHRSLLSIIGALPLVVKQFWQVLRVLAILGVVLFMLPPYGMGEPVIPNLAFTAWLALLPLSLLVILIQTSAEEILFRGYIQQTLAARFSSPLIWMGLPAVLFALGHYMPDEAGDSALLIALWAGIFALLTADLTARSGTLGPAIAMHLFNNITALLFISLPDSLSGLSLYLTPFSMSDSAQMQSWLAVDFVMMGVSWLAARVALAR